MLSKEYVEQLKEDGFVTLQDYLGGYELGKIRAEISCMNEMHYNEENLKSGVAYPSDSTETRTSNAYLIGNGGCYFPHINLQMHEYYGIDSILNDWNSLISIMEGHAPTVGISTNHYDVSDSSTMINFQEYREASKPVPPHMDGHYLEYTCNDDGTMSVTEALVPNFVGVLVLHNENDNDVGTVLVEVDTGKRIPVQAAAGDFVIFDNIRFTHEVPSLEKPRAMLGLRNFTYKPYRFTQKRVAPLKSYVGSFFEGYIERIGDKDAVEAWVESSGYEEAPF